MASSTLANFFLQQKQMKHQVQQSREGALSSLNQYRRKECDDVATPKSYKAPKKATTFGYACAYSTMADIDDFFRKQKQLDLEWKEKKELALRKMHTYRQEHVHKLPATGSSNATLRDSGNPQKPGREEDSNEDFDNQQQSAIGQQDTAILNSLLLVHAELKDFFTSMTSFPDESLQEEQIRLADSATHVSDMYQELSDDNKSVLALETTADGALIEPMEDESIRTGTMLQSAKSIMEPKKTPPDHEEEKKDEFYINGPNESLGDEPLLIATYPDENGEYDTKASAAAFEDDKESKEDGSAVDLINQANALLALYASGSGEDEDPLSIAVENDQGAGFSEDGACPDDEPLVFPSDDKQNCTLELNKEAVAQNCSENADAFGESNPSEAIQNTFCSAAIGKLSPTTDPNEEVFREQCIQATEQLLVSSPPMIGKADSTVSSIGESVEETGSMISCRSDASSLSSFWKQDLPPLPDAPEDFYADLLACNSEQYLPNLHSSRGPCERCLSVASEEERRKFLATGRHVRIMLCRGGCRRSCSSFPRSEDQPPVRLCRKCYFDTHRPAKQSPGRNL